MNLVGPIDLRRSHDTPGIQLADVLAAAAAGAFAEPSEEWSKDVLQLLFASGSISDESILPEWKCIDLNLSQPLLNVEILFELLKRSERGDSLTHGLAEYIPEASRFVASYLESRPAAD
jgi:hypothetical protein